MSGFWLELWAAQRAVKSGLTRHGNWAAKQACDEMEKIMLAIRGLQALQFHVASMERFDGRHAAKQRWPHTSRKTVCR